MQDKYIVMISAFLVLAFCLAISAGVSYSKNEDALKAKYLTECVRTHSPLECRSSWRTVGMQ